MKKFWFLLTVILFRFTDSMADTSPLPPTPKKDTSLMFVSETELKEMANQLGYGITWDEVVNSEAVKGRGGSPLFHFYLLLAINSLDSTLKDDKTGTAYRNQFISLCKDLDCEKGLDLDKITSDTIVAVLRFFSIKDPFPVDIYEDDEATKLRGKVWFLQGFLSPHGMGPDRYQTAIAKGDYETPGDLPHREALRRAILSDRSVKEILVNLPHQFGLERNQHYDANVFMELGRFIKSRNLSLRIIGGCGTFCANYLLPSAEKVIIEPYGYIYTQGGIHGLLAGAKSAMSSQVDDQLKELRKEWLPVLTNNISSSPNQPSEKPDSLLVEFVTQGMALLFGLTTLSELPEKTPKQRKAIMNDFIGGLKIFGRPRWGEDFWEEFSDHFSRYQTITGKSFQNWTKKDDITGFVRSMDNEGQRHFLERIALFMEIHYSREEIPRQIAYINDLEWLGSYTTPYYQQMGRDLESELFYTYDMLLNLIPQLVRDRAYELMFSVPKTFYAVPEEEKPFVAAPSAGLLRQLGLRVTGEVNLRMLVRNRKDKVLYLDEEIIKKCEFFESLHFHTGKTAAFSTKEAFQTCAAKE